MTKLANDAGIPIVYVNRQPIDVDALGPKGAFVASNEADSGTLETKEVCRLLGGKGDILVMQGDLANQAAIMRTKDVHDVIATPECSGMKIIDEQTAGWDPVKAQDLMTNWIAAGHKPAAVIANSSDVHIVDPQTVPNPNWLRPGIPGAGQQAFGDDLLRRHRFVAIPSAVSPHSWNLIFLAGAAPGAYALKFQESFALDTRLHPPAA